ncbi:Hypothetical predicted protein, partial [Olea europaea subsp. europaea]
DFTYFANLGSLIYPQRQGFCSLSLLQQTAEGGRGEVNASRHGVSSAALQVTASVICMFPSSTTTATKYNTAQPAFFISLDYG